MKGGEMRRDVTHVTARQAACLFPSQFLHNGCYVLLSVSNYIPASATGIGTLHHWALHFDFPAPYWHVDRNTGQHRLTLHMGIFGMSFSARLLSFLF